MSDLPTRSSPATYINLPKYILPAPTTNGVSNGIVGITITGAAECRDAASPNQVNEVDVYAVGSPFDTKLSIVNVLVLHPAGAWDGLLLAYSAAPVLLQSTDQNGSTFTLSGNNSEISTSLGNLVSVYQYLREPASGILNEQSSAVDLQ